MKRAVLAVVAVWVAWSVLDFVMHGVILQSTYAATAHLWRPMNEMKMTLMHVVRLLASIFFVTIYARLAGEKSVGAGLVYGLLFGLGTGISMGYGTYAVMPVPYRLAITWFLGTVVQATVAGGLVGLIVRGEQPRSAPAATA